MDGYQLGEKKKKAVLIFLVVFIKADDISQQIYDV